MSAWEFSPEAKNDLEEIRLYIATDNPPAADAIEAEIYEACDLLARNPGLGHKRRHLTDEPVLFWPVRARYLVIYQRDSRPSRIARILHGSRECPGGFESS